MRREAGGVVTVFVGVVFLLLAVNGTFSNVWKALTTSGGSAPSQTPKPTTVTQNPNGSVNIGVPVNPPPVIVPPPNPAS